MAFLPGYSPACCGRCNPRYSNPYLELTIDKCYASRIKIPSPLPVPPDPSQLSQPVLQPLQLYPPHPSFPFQLSPEHPSTLSLPPPSFPIPLPQSSHPRSPPQHQHGPSPYFSIDPPLHPPRAPQNQSWRA